MSKQLWDLIVCPACGMSGSIKHSPSLTCQNCSSDFFWLGNIPCLFPSGRRQQDLWNHLFAALIDEGQQAAAALNVELASPDVSALTVERLKNTLHLHWLTQEAMVELLQTSGFRPVKNVAYDQYSMNSFLIYYHLMLRDWGWDSSAAWQREDRKFDENRVALENVLQVLNPILSVSERPSRVLFIGAGAGRLSWDVHCVLKPEMTVALDFNPLLVSVGARLIRNGETLYAYERNQEHGGDGSAFFQWPLTCSEGEPHLRDTWFPMLADAWTMPFAAQSFDLIVTPWFIDVMHRDCKDLIAVVEKLLIPGGHWLNYGPFLYGNDFSERCKYTSTELKDFLQLAQFSIVNEQFFQVPYNFSPLTNSGRVERVWGALAKSSLSRSHLDDAGAYDRVIDQHVLPAWMVLPHLPIPRLTKPGLFPAELINVTQFINGKNSINDIKSYIAPHLPSGIDAGDIIYQLLLDYVVDRTDE